MNSWIGVECAVKTTIRVETRDLTSAPVIRANTKVISKNQQLAIELGRYPRDCAVMRLENDLTDRVKLSV